jgi:glucose/arabinose dehydrogenase
MSTPRSTVSARRHRRLGLLVVLVLALVAPACAPLPPPPGGTLVEEIVFSGLTEPTAVQFAPDGRVFVAEKSGLIKVFDDLTDTTPTV